MRTRAIIFSLAASLSIVGGAGPVFSQSYPSGVVRLVVPYPAGGGVDGVARLLAERLASIWRQSVVVENRAGANGNVGAEYVVRSAPDGQTMLFSPSPIFTTAKLLYKNLSFDPGTDLKPVTLVASTPNVVMVSPQLPVTDAHSFFEYARKRPGELAYASQGIGSTAHLTLAYMAQAAGLDIKHVPYRGAALALNDVMAGHVAATADGLSSALGILQGGKIRPLFVASKERAKVTPEIPTSADVGLADFESESWYGVAVPKETGDAVVETIQQAFARILAEPEIQKNLVGRGARVISSTPAEMADYIKADSDRWKKVIDSQKIEIPQ